MIKHLFKMVWNRKRWNVLILLEIFLSFLVLFAVATAGFTLWNYHRNPLGFNYHNIWMLTMDTPPGAMNDDNFEGTLAIADQIDNFLKNQGPVQVHGTLNTPPYRNSSWNTSFTVDQRKVRTSLSLVSIGLLDALQLKIAEGRWFNESDFTDKKVTPVVANGRLARELFPNESAIGKRVVDEYDDEIQEFEIIGVIDHFRKEGELNKPRQFGFLPFVLKKDIWLPRYSLLRMNQNVDPAYEEQLIKGLERIAPDWSFKVQPYTQTRANYLQRETRNLKIMALVAFFLLLMVAMGLIGVLWQHVTRRTVELGVRRAKGATRNKIYTQIIGEFLVIATLAIGLGLVFVAQVPFTGLFKNASFGVMAMAFVASGLAIYVLTVIASLYPGWMATKIMPAEALHYE